MFRNETEKMTRRLSELNQVYSRLLQAMTVNMGAPAYHGQQAQPTAYQQQPTAYQQQPQYGYQPQAPYTTNQGQQQVAR